MTIFLLVLLAINSAALVFVLVLYKRAKKAQKRRRVEAPNSQYKSQYVMDLDSKERWESIELGRLHEVNREEVEKTLAKLRATSVRALTNNERALLDRMAESQERTFRRGRGSSAGAGGARPRQLPGTS